MGKTIYVIDIDGYFLSEMFVTGEENIEHLNYTDIKPPNGIKPKWNGVRWVVDDNNGESPEELFKPTIYDRLDAIESVLMDLLIK
ncbi:hypothetical protein [Heyndrickxia faecalis]|uniref:hypothetical protein n=1 Tax=Heyndrickxia faecalis TaxID=2824910 RepID=UPI003D20D21C